MKNAKSHLLIGAIAAIPTGMVAARALCAFASALTGVRAGPDALVDFVIGGAIVGLGFAIAFFAAWTDS